MWCLWASRADGCLRPRPHDCPSISSSCRTLSSSSAFAVDTPFIGDYTFVRYKIQHSTISFLKYMRLFCYNFVARLPATRRRRKKKTKKKNKTHITLSRTIDGERRRSLIFVAIVLNDFRFFFVGKAHQNKESVVFVSRIGVASTSSPFHS